MRPRTEYHDARRTLIELLREPAGGLVDLSTLTDAEREFMKVTCSHIVMLYTICFAAGFDAAKACEGFAAATVDTRKMIYGICDEEKPTP